MPNARTQAPKSQSQSPQAALHKLFSRLKLIRNLSLGAAALGGSLSYSAQRKTLGTPSIVAAATLTGLALISAATAQVLLSLNEQLEESLNQAGTPKSPAKPQTDPAPESTPESRSTQAESEPESESPADPS
ncbi:MAG: hypothetical protein IV090_12180 [Candidatus Sericytochromatia bacterium]|nr:hypothetical protein [Candidatus Sericytochromatia bacterium]